MNMPGFTADASLYKATGQYRAMAGAANSMTRGRGVLPQLPRQISLMNCLGDCGFTYNDDDQNRIACINTCYWDDFVHSGDGDQGGGGGGHFCHPTCGKCHHDTRSPSGSSRTCILADCSREREDCGDDWGPRSSVSRGHQDVTLF